MRHLLDTRTLDYSDALDILDGAEAMAKVEHYEVKKLPALRGRTVVNLFFEDSTRTRVSFEVAAKRLSADVINFVAKGSSLSKGESLKDTAQTLAAMGIDAIVIRHSASGAAQRLADSGWVDATVINAGDGTHEHPTQALLDIFTLRHHWSKVKGNAESVGQDLKGMRVIIAGDILHSRVARSQLWLLRTLGATVMLVGPPPLLPESAVHWPAELYYDFDEAMAHKPDAIMMLRVQLERMGGAFFPSSQEYSRYWGLNDARLRRLDSWGLDTAILHPGPVNRGVEVSAAVVDSPRSLIRDQVRNGVPVRMSILHALLNNNQR